MMTQSTAWKQFEDETKDTTLEERLHAGVCANCAHADLCGILHGASRVIHHCELYECCAPVAMQAARESERFVEPDRPHMLGLCANCDLRAECKLPKPASGVWHCEEYC